MVHNLAMEALARVLHSAVWTGCTYWPDCWHDNLGPDDWDKMATAALAALTPAGEDCGCNQEGEHGPDCPPWCDKRPTPTPAVESGGPWQEKARAAGWYEAGEACDDIAAAVWDRIKPADWVSPGFPLSPKAFLDQLPTTPPPTEPVEE